MYVLNLTHSFSAAHQLKDYIGECANVHGHTWKVNIKIETDTLVKDMVIDFKVLKKAIDERFDHKFINEMVNYNPTAENISKDIYDIVDHLVNQDREVRKIAVTVWESDKAKITYSE